ncbi:hypothetical protein [Desulfotruncus arcticus]|uniref:hypothetical protein n=1 Tax=Desulfotruncus arcticus TaxID=341036 RepID=UPI0013F4F21F|nr:hypothetical protein [Desulfotruncus arcticus]
MKNSINNAQSLVKEMSTALNGSIDTQKLRQITSKLDILLSEANQRCAELL